MPVSSLEAALNWYQKVFQVEAPAITEAEEIMVEFDLGLCWLQLEQDPVRAGKAGIGFNLETADLVGQHERLMHAGVTVTDIEGVEGCMEYFEAVDPDDNRIGFIQPWEEQPA